MFTKAIKGMITGILVLGFSGVTMAEESVTPMPGHPQHEVEGAAGPVGVTGTLGVVSNYVWRGVEQTGTRTPAVQGSLDFSFAAVPGLAIGNWNSNAAGMTETDYYLSYTGAAGDLGYKAGLTLYSYEFKSFGTKTNADGTTANVAVQKEIFVGATFGSFSGTYYMVPSEDSTYGKGETTDASVSLSWLDLGYSTEVLGLTTAITYGTGTYNQQWLNAGAAVESTAILTLSLSKSVSESVTASFNKTHVMTQSANGTGLHNEFWMGLSTTF